MKYKIFILTFLFLFSGNLIVVNADEIDDSYVQNILSSQDEKSFNLLINQGLDVNSLDKDGYTMLYYVLKNNKDLKMAKKLIEAGADVNLPSSNGMTPLLIATSKANELQLKKINISDDENSVQKEIREAIINEKIEEEIERSVSILKMLIEAGADVNQETPYGTPLMSASISDLNNKMVEILIKEGAKIDQQDKNGRTALFYAQIFDSQEIIGILIKNGADVSIKDKNGKTYMESENFIGKN
jgi:serine/threonine-protein phosphatase 6 regulatory ankyrin repeat subunit A